MNREQRRKAGIKEKPKTLNVKAETLQKIKEEATNDAVKKAFNLMLGIPVLILHDKYSQFTRKEVDGKSRVERFADECLKHYEMVEKGLVSYEDIINILREEAGVELVEVKK